MVDRFYLKNVSLGCNLEYEKKKNEKWEKKVNSINKKRNKKTNKKKQQQKTKKKKQKKNNNKQTDWWVLGRRQSVRHQLFALLLNRHMN